MIALALDFGRSGPALAQETPAQPAPAVPFSHDWLLEEARRRAAEAFQEPAADLPDGLGEITYDQYRDIRFRPEARIWGEDPTEFKLDLLHRGFIYQDRVAIHIVEGGPAIRIPFSPRMFDYGPLVTAPAAGEDLGFSGFRVRSPINTPDILDEFAVFQGASYFRAVGRDQIYGISARGLAINTAEPRRRGVPRLPRVLDRAAGARRRDPRRARVARQPFDDRRLSLRASRPARKRPSTWTRRSSRARRSTKVGIAPLTSMFMFDATNHGGFDDFRRAVHDSDGLQMLTGAGEWVWRPLANPHELQISDFMDQRAARLRPDAARPALRGFRGPRGELRAAPEPVDRADRRLGRGLRRAGRDPARTGDQRQHRRLLAAERPGPGRRPLALRLSHALDRPAFGRAPACSQ